MTGPEFYTEAEGDLERAERASDRGRSDDAAFYLQSAQIKATLALAAATALGREGNMGTLPPRESTAWFAAAGTPKLSEVKA